MTIIRPATMTDSSVLVSLLGILGYEVSKPDVEDRLKHIIASPQDKILVAVDNDQVVGFIHLFIKRLLERPVTAENGALVVAEGMQGKGIGKLLIQAGEKWAIEQGCKRLVVKSNIMRTGAHVFYQRVGYADTKRQVVFEKSL